MFALQLNGLWHMSHCCCIMFQYEPGMIRGHKKHRRPRVDPYKLDLDNLTGEENVSVINKETGKKVWILQL